MAAKGQYYDDRKLLDGSAQPCGCDTGIGWQCDKHRPQGLPTQIMLPQFSKADLGGLTGPVVAAPPSAPQRSEDAQKTRAGHVGTQPTGLQVLMDPAPSLFPGTDRERKALPVWSGVVMYFPRAMREISRVSFIGNEQHNPGEPLHWAKGKSTNQSDTAMRHAMDHAAGNHYDTDGTLHQAKACWRAMAELETFLEAQERNQ